MEKSAQLPIGAGPQERRYSIIEEECLVIKLTFQVYSYSLRKQLL